MGILSVNPYPEKTFLNRVGRDVWTGGTSMKIENYDMDSLEAPEPVNMENFGGLQYIIDRLPAQERFVLKGYFVYGVSKTKIAELIGKSTKVVDRILRNLRRIDLTDNGPVITFRGKTFPLESLNGCN
jgi:DNA-directed RNA polymerase specialized sigma24 family protein